MFNQLGLHSQLIAALKTAKIESPTDVQSKVIPALMDGADIQVSAETGSGKTFSYMLPLVHKMKQPEKAKSGSRALILLPTRELAQQTFKELSKLARFTKTSSVLIIGGQESRYQASLLRRDPDVVIATPGRLIEHLDKGSAILDQIEMLVLDEADRMLDMGFRDDVLDIVSRCNPNRQSALLSATLSHRGITFIAQQILTEPQVFNIANAQTKHENISQKIILSDSVAHKKKQLLWILNNEKFDKAVVFANKRVQVSQLCNWLRDQDIHANELHGDIPQDERKHVMSSFAQDRFNVLVATDVAARGLDIEGVDLVVNFDMAHSGDEYVHRIGRTGRAGRLGVAISLVSDYEWNLSAGIQRYLKQTFEPFIVPGLKGKYKGSKKVKSSGLAAGKSSKKKGNVSRGLSKKKRTLSAKKKEATEPEKKQRHRDKKNVGKRRLTTAEQVQKTESNSEAMKNGMAPPKKRAKKDEQ